MRQTLSTAILVLLLARLQAQRVIDITKTDGNTATDHTAYSAVLGQLYTGIKYVRLTAGTPFFKDQFMKAVLYDDEGGRYRSDAVRINLLENEVNFIGPDGQEMTCSSPVRRIILTDSISGASYSFIWGRELAPDDRSLEKIWFQVLVNDETSLCRQIKKRIHETPAYGTATTDEDIITTDAFFVRKEGRLIPVKSWDDLLNALQDRKAAITQYIHDHKLKGKSTDDYTQLVTAYNKAQKP